MLAHIILQEKLHVFSILGCALCVVGSTMIVLYAPQERDIESVKEVWDLATEPGLFLFVYCWWQSNVTLICTYFPYLFIGYDAPWRSI